MLARADTRLLVQLERVDNHIQILDRYLQSSKRQEYIQEGADHRNTRRDILSVRKRRIMFRRRALNKATEFAESAGNTVSGLARLIRGDTISKLRIDIANQGLGDKDS